MLIVKNTGTVVISFPKIGNLEPGQFAPVTEERAEILLARPMIAALVDAGKIFIGEADDIPEPIPEPGRTIGTDADNDGDVDLTIDLDDIDEDED